MKTASLSGSSRESVGSKDAKQLRKEERIPAVLYGGDEQIHLHLPVVPVEKLVYNPDVFKIELEVGGKTYPTILKEVQFHPVTDKILHVDFLQLFDDRPVVVNIPVRTKGSSVGVLNGGRLAINHRTLTLRGLPGDIPEHVTLDITKLDISDVIRVRDIEAEKFTIIQAASDVVVSVKRTRAAMAAAAAAAAESK